MLSNTSSKTTKITDISLKLKTRIQQKHEGSTVQEKSKSQLIVVTLQEDQEYETKNEVLRQTLSQLYPTLSWVDGEDGEVKLTIPYSLLEEQQLDNFDRLFAQNENPEPSLLLPSYSLAPFRDSDAKNKKPVQKFTLSQINAKSFEELALISYESTLDASGQNCVLIIGNTQAGKSTLINYLMGCEIAKQRMSGRDVAVIKKGEETSAIGHQLSQSETFMPHIVRNKNLPFAYCDCPGFNETRGEKVSFCTDMSIPLVIEFSNSIQAVALVIEYGAITGGGRGQGFRELMMTVKNLIKGTRGIEDSILFLITKAPVDITVVNLRETISKFHDELTEEAWQPLDLSPHNPRKEEEKIKKNNVLVQLELLTLMKNDKNLLIANVFDNSGVSRDKIINRLVKMSPIPKTSFNLALNPNDSSLKNKRKNIALDAIRNGSKLLLERQSIIKQMNQVRKEHQKLQGELKDSIKKKENLEDKNYPFSYGEEIERLELENKMVNMNILRAQERISSVNQGIEKIAGEISGLKGNNEIVTMKKEYTAKNDNSWSSFSAAGTSIKHEDEANPFTQIDVTEEILGVTGEEPAISLYNKLIIEFWEKVFADNIDFTLEQNQNKLNKIFTKIFLSRLVLGEAGDNVQLLVRLLAKLPDSPDDGRNNKKLFDIASIIDELGLQSCAYDDSKIKADNEKITQYLNFESGIALGVSTSVSAGAGAAAVVASEAAVTVAAEALFLGLGICAAPALFIVMILAFGHFCSRENQQRLLLVVEHLELIKQKVLPEFQEKDYRDSVLDSLKRTLDIKSLLQYKTMQEAKQDIAQLKARYLPPCGQFSPAVTNSTELRTKFETHYTPTVGKHVRFTLTFHVPKNQQKITKLEIEKLQQKEKALQQQLVSQQSDLSNLEKNQELLKTKLTRALATKNQEIEQQRAQMLEDIKPIIAEKDKQVKELSIKLDTHNQELSQLKIALQSKLGFFDMILEMHHHAKMGGADIFELSQEQYVADFIFDYENFSRKQYIFEFRAQDYGKADIISVYVVGNFNQWLKDGDDSAWQLRCSAEDPNLWQLEAELPSIQGGYQYQFKINNNPDFWPAEAYTAISDTVEKIAVSNDSNEIAKTPGAETQLHKAIRLGQNIEQLILTEKDDINAPEGTSGHMPLHYAVLYQNIGALNILLHQKSLLKNYQNKEGETAIYLACKQGWLEGVKAFKSHGVDLDKSDKEGNSPLHIALKNERGDIVEYLLGRGVIKTGVNKAGETPLFIAVNAGKANLVKLLLQSSSLEAFRMNNKHQSPMHLAVELGRLDLLQLLVNFLKPNTISAVLSTKLSSRNKAGAFDILNLKNSQGDTLYHQAARKGSLEIVLWILERDIFPIDAFNNDGFTALQLAVLAGYVELVEFLLSKSANIELKNALHQSAEFIVKSMADNRDSYDLQLAQRYGKIEKVFTETKKQKLVNILKNERNWYPELTHKLLNESSFTDFIKENEWSNIVKLSDRLAKKMYQNYKELNKKANGALGKENNLQHIANSLPMWIAEFKINDSSKSSIPVLGQVSTDNEKEFEEVLKNGLQQYYYIAFGTSDELVRRPLNKNDETAQWIKDGGETFCQAMTVVGSAVGSVADKFVPNFGIPTPVVGSAAGAAIGMTGGAVANAVSRFIVNKNEEESKQRAQNMISAFGRVNKRQVDSDQIKKVVDAMVFRYRDQINELASSNDAAIFAHYIVERIIDHIAAGRHRYVDQPDGMMEVAMASAKQRMTSSAQPSDELPIEKRCILAVQLQTKELSKEKRETYRCQTKKGSKWYLSNIIEHAGAKIIRTEGIAHYTQTGEEKGWEVYGFFYAHDEDEIKHLKENKKFILNHSVHQPAATTSSATGQPMLNSQSYQRSASSSQINLRTAEQASQMYRK